MASVQHCDGWYLGGQAGDTGHGLSCMSAWLGGGSLSTSSSSPPLPWDLINVNFGLHDLNDNGKEVPIATYQKNIGTLFGQLVQTKAKLIFTTTTPVPKGDGGGTRTEANVQKYNVRCLFLAIRFCSRLLTRMLA